MGGGGGERRPKDRVKTGRLYEKLYFIVIFYDLTMMLNHFSFVWFPLFWGARMGLNNLS